MLMYAILKVYGSNPPYSKDMRIQKIILLHMR